jgi:putative ATP-dependent endonuclease of OLD family
MKIKKIVIENYRGIKKRQEIPLSNFSSIVGRNDSGKSIILNAIASFLDISHYPIVESDFNDPTNPIFIECHFVDDNLGELLENKIKSKIKKIDGLDEFINDILFEDSLIVQKLVSQPGKKFNNELIVVEDFEDETFSMLYTKSDEQLNKILEEYKIDIPVKGKGRNSKLEKIKYIKQFCIENSICKTFKSISDEYKITTLLPAVELFVSDYGLKTDTSFKTHSVSEIKDYFERETADDTRKLKQVEKEIQQEMNNEAEVIKNYMLDYTTSLKKVEIIPNIVWKDAIKSVDVSFQFEGDEKPIPMSHKGTGYRRLFMVARFRYLAEKDKGNNVIYLIEEPEAFLHPAAQQNLLDAFKELSGNNQIIITTHSPVFAGSTDYRSIILCKKENQSIYEHANETNKDEFIMHIIEELGIKPSYNLRDHHEKIVFVESKNDAKFYDIICKKVLEKNLLDNKKILVLPFGGGEDIDSFINIDYFDYSGRDLFLIIDSDKQGNNQDKQQRRIDKFNLKERGKGYMLKKSCIENHYHPRALERVYSLPENTFDFFSENENVDNKLKQMINKNEELGKKNIKRKNNIKVFEEMTKEEWLEVIEPELIDFLREIAE